MQLILTSVLRHLLSTLGGILAVDGVATDSNVQLVYAALLVIVAPVWSWVEKKYFIKK
jgi:hypothetical protein